MSDPVSNSNPSTDTAGRGLRLPAPHCAWFRTPLGRRYGVEIALVLGMKLALLVLLWLVFIQPWPRPPAASAAVVQTFYMPAAAAPAHD